MGLAELFGHRRAFDGGRNAHAQTKKKTPPDYLFRGGFILIICKTTTRAGPPRPCIILICESFVDFRFRHGRRNVVIYSAGADTYIQTWEPFDYPICNEYPPIHLATVRVSSILSRVCHCASMKEECIPVRLSVAAYWRRWMWQPRWSQEPFARGGNGNVATKNPTIRSPIYSSLTSIVHK